MDNLTFSVIIPAYNCEETLRDSAMSALCQLGPDDEVIVVDDCSDDETYEVAYALSQDDSRVKAIRLPRNSGCLAARCKGVLESHGSKILFLDADDTYSDDLIAVLRSVFADHDYDIVHFGLEMWVTSETGSRIDAVAQRWFDPFDGEIAGQDVFAKCFLERRYQWNLVNKCIDGELCRRSCCFAPSHRVQRGEDAFLFFVIAYFAQSYIGLRASRFYRYNFGAGQDSARRITLAEYAELCKSADAARAMQEFVDGQQAEDVYRNGLARARGALAGGCANKLRDQVAPGDAYEALATFAEAWGWPTAIEATATAYNGNTIDFFKHAVIPQAKPLENGGTIASFYWMFSGGGAENVQKMLVKVWRTLGLNVVLLLEREPDAGEIADLGVEYRVIPNAREGGYAKRVEALNQAIEDFGIQGIVYHQWLERQLGWDLAYFKSRGLPFYVHCHGIFVHCMESGDSHFCEMPWVYQHADGVVSLSEVDASYWSLFNPRTFVTVNPSLYSSASVDHSLTVADHRVLWLGRVSPEKGPEDALKVFARVLQLVPDAQLDFVGGAIDPNYEEGIHKIAEALGISDSITFVGWSNDQEKYYTQARVFLMTSEPKEGYPLTLGECQAFGVPCVMYDLPYLTLVRKSKGISVVEPGDIESAAQRVAQVLCDDDVYASMRSGAFDMARQVESFDFAGLWKSVLFETTAAPTMPVNREVASIAANTVLTAFEMDCDLQSKRAEAEQDRLHRRIQCLEAEQRKNDKKHRKQMRDIKKSVSWKLGRSLTFVPRVVCKMIHRFYSFCESRARGGAPREVQPKVPSRMLHADEHRFDNMVSLGYNCEVSFRIQDYLKKPINSFPLSWAYIKNQPNMYFILSNLDYLTDAESFEWNNNSKMYYNRYLDISVHSKIDSTCIDFSDEVQVQDFLAKSQVEVVQRFTHLCEKWHQLMSEDSSTLFLFKLQSWLTEDQCVEAVVNTYLYLKENYTSKRYLLACIVDTDDRFNILASNPRLRNQSILMLKVARFADDSDTQNGGDIESWMNAIESANHIGLIV